MIGRVEVIHGVEGALFHDVSFVAEGLESVETMVVSGAAHADSAERDRQIFNLQYAMIDAGRTRCGASDDFVDSVFRFSENV